MRATGALTCWAAMLFAGMTALLAGCDMRIEKKAAASKPQAAMAIVPTASSVYTLEGAHVAVTPIDYVLVYETFRRQAVARELGVRCEHPEREAVPFAALLKASSELDGTEEGWRRAELALHGLVQAYPNSDAAKVAGRLLGELFGGKCGTSEQAGGQL